MGGGPRPDLCHCRLCGRQHQAGSCIACGGLWGERGPDRTGWAAGGGIEYALLNNWSIKGEYLRVHLDRFTCGAACTGVAGQTVAVKFDVNMFRAGINYKFNWGGPI